MRTIRTIIRQIRPIGHSGLISLIVLLCLIACNNEGPDLSQQAQRPVTFSTFTGQFQTRGAEDLKTFPDGGSMGIYAYYHENSNWAADAATIIPNFMYNQKATYIAEQSIFSYYPLKYWPNSENNKVSFIAYYPYSNGDADDGTDYDIETTGVAPLLANSEAGLPTFSFTVSDDADNQKDMLVSNLIVNLPKSRDTKDDPGTEFNDLTIYDKVKFLFNHALAKVEFRIVADPAISKDIVKFKILEALKISNINKTGKMTPAYDVNTGVTSLSWSEQTTPHDYSFKTFEPQLLLPQAISNSAMLTVKYEITFKSDGTTYVYDDNGDIVPQQEYTYSNTASVQLNTLKRSGTNTALDTWEANHHYIYTIRLTARSIEFTGQVVDWGDTVPVSDIQIGEQ